MFTVLCIYQNLYSVLLNMLRNVLKECFSFSTQRIRFLRTVTSKPITISLVGAGRLGCMHLHNVLNDPRCAVRYIVDNNSDVFDNVLSKYPILGSNYHQCKLVTDENIALEDSSVQAAVICTPTSHHERQITKALQYNKHVFCEKPISDTVNAIESCYKMSQKQNLYLFCAFTKRFDPSMAEAIQSVKDGKLGKIHVIKTVGIDPHFPPPGFLMDADFMIHDFDLSTQIIGEKPDHVFGIGRSHYEQVKEQAQWDTIFANLQFPTGAVAILQNGRFASYGYDIRVEIFGEKGMIQVENMNNNFNCFYSQTGQHRSRIGDRDFYLNRYKDAFKLEMIHFFDVLQGKSKPSVFEHEATLACSLADAAFKSATQNIIVKV